jgi:hypothetical protein
MSATRPRRRKASTIILELPSNKPHSVSVRGSANVVAAGLRSIDCPWMWDHGLNSYLAPRVRAHDIEALFVSDGHTVEVRGALA